MPRRIHYVSAALDGAKVPLDVAARTMEAFMLRNFATAGWTFQSEGRTSIPGCIIASPSRPDASDVTDQDYVHVWVRDAAICALAAARSPFAAEGLLEHYVEFSTACAASAAAAGKAVGHACFEIDGSVRDWSEQSDGPAMQITTLLKLSDRLPPAAKEAAKALIRKDLVYLLGAFDRPTTNLWEETQGLSFFARAVQLRAFTEAGARAAELGIADLMASIGGAVERLRPALEAHWDEAAQGYRSVLEAPGARGAGLNADVIMAAVYGELPCTIPKLLATAARIRAEFSGAYAINTLDAARGLGPVIGRYPEDTYDGDMADPSPDFGHPWALCTCNFAELYYRIAAATRRAGKVTIDGRTRPFFAQLGVAVPPADTTITEAASVARFVAALREAGDRMLRAVVYHSDHLELSEQFDKDTGYEKSVRNLTWSYASFVDAVRARAT